MSGDDCDDPFIDEVLSDSTMSTTSCVGCTKTHMSFSDKVGSDTDSPKKPNPTPLLVFFSMLPLPDWV